VIAYWQIRGSMGVAGACSASGSATYRFFLPFDFESRPLRQSKLL
jgi:hypothetical protein